MKNTVPTSLALLSILLAPIAGFAATPSPAPFCIAVGGGFGAPSFGSTYVARNFTLPGANQCNPWTGYTKTATTVVLTTSGTACLSSDSKALTVSVTSADPEFFGTGTLAADYIKMSRASVNDTFSGSDAGIYLGGSAEQTTCSNDLLNLPASHD